MSFLIIAIGGGLGAVFRFIVGQQVPFYFDKMSVNIISSFIIARVFVYMAGQNEERAMLVFMLGVFTTFSVFFLDLLKLLEVENPLFAFRYFTRSVVASLVVLVAGVTTMQVALT
jgi:fluoride exporter